jgi:hypothetical protein
MPCLGHGTEHRVEVSVPLIAAGLVPGQAAERAAPSCTRAVCRVSRCDLRRRSVGAGACRPGRPQGQRPTLVPGPAPHAPRLIQLRLYSATHGLVVAD